MAKLLEGNRLSHQGCRIARSTKVTVFFDEFLIPRFSFYQLVQNAVGNGQVRLRLHEQHMIRLLAGSCVPRRKIDQFDVFTSQTSVHHTAEQYGVHLGKIVAPQ